jgi:quercetin dioxygenase-like cupin family protein
MNRRTLLDTLLTAGVGAMLSPTLATAGTSEIDKPVLQQDLPTLSLDNWRMTAVEVTYGPGEMDKAHRHPGFVFGYVIEGALRFQVDGQPETIYHAGQMFYEAPGSVHRVSGNGSATRRVRFIAMIFADKTQPLTAPA